MMRGIEDDNCFENSKKKGEKMALTSWEAVKVIGTTLTDMGTKGEKFEDEHPGESYKPNLSDIVELVTETLTNLGKEIMD